MRYDLIDYVDTCCDHGLPRKHPCAACEAEIPRRPVPTCAECGGPAVENWRGWQCKGGCEAYPTRMILLSPEQRNLHDGGECHKMENPCPLCGKSYENTRGEV